MTVKRILITLSFTQSDIATSVRELGCSDFQYYWICIALVAEASVKYGPELDRLEDVAVIHHEDVGLPATVEHVEHPAAAPKAVIPGLDAAEVVPDEVSAQRLEVLCVGVEVILQVDGGKHSFRGLRTA